MFDRKKYKDFAKIQLRNRWTVPMLITLIVFLITNLFSLVDSLNNFGGLSMEEMKELLASGYSGISSYLAKNQKNQAFEFLISLVQCIISFILEYSGISVYLKMSRSPEPVPFSTFIDGLSDWARAVLTGCWKFLWIFIWCLLAIPVAVAASFIAALFLTKLPMLTVSEIIMAVTCLGFIPAIIRAIAYSQMFYITCECPEVSIRKAMKISIKITNGHKTDIFVMYLSFIPLYFLEAITLGILQIVFEPFIRMTMTNMYHGLLKEALENGQVNPCELKSVIEESNEEKENENSEDVKFINSSSDSNKINQENDFSEADSKKETETNNQPVQSEISETEQENSSENKENFTVPVTETENQQPAEILNEDDSINTERTISQEDSTNE